MRRWRSAGGQATSEYVALVALVAVVLALAAGLTSGGVGGRVLARMQRGLCRVADVRCPAPKRPRDELDPCPVERTSSAESLAGAFELLQLGGGAALSAVRMSDGRVRIGLADVETVGGAIGLGYSIGLGRRHGATATLEIGRRFAPGRSWTLPDAAAARRFVERYGAKATVAGKAVDLVRSGCSILCDAIGWRPHAALPPADEVTIDRARIGGGGGSLAGGRVEGSSGRVMGARLGRDGVTTWYLGFDAALDATLMSSAGVGAGRQRQAVVALTLDARRRPVELSVETVRSVAASGTLSAAGRRASARAEGAVGYVTELEATLDLRDARNRAAAVALRTALDDQLAVARLQRSVAAVGERIARAGVVTRRTYAVSSSAFALGGELVLGARLGAGFERTRDAMRLIAAETRLPGLPFLPRDDCRSA